MNVINVPIVEFYKNCIPAAKDSGFMYIVSLIARDADIFELYDNLLKQWNSLDSVTGRNFLFIIAGNESSEHVDENSLIYLDHSCGCYKYNPYIKILKERRMSLNIEDNANDLCHQEIEIHQTKAVNKLKEYFHIKESQIPCLVFKDISSQRYKNIIIPVTEDNLYQYFKKLFNDIEPLLSELELINQQLKKRQNGNLSMKRENIISSINKEIRKNKMGSYETQRQHEPQQFNVNYNQTFENNTIYGGTISQNITNPQNLDVINNLIDAIMEQLANTNTPVNTKEIIREVKEDLNKEKSKSTLDKIKKKLMPLKDVVDIASFITTLIDLISKL